MRIPLVDIRFNIYAFIHVFSSLTEMKDGLTVFTFEVKLTIKLSKLLKDICHSRNFTSKQTTHIILLDVLIYHYEKHTNNTSLFVQLHSKTYSTHQYSEDNSVEQNINYLILLEAIETQS